jgi:hypothetical protein
MDRTKATQDPRKVFGGLDNRTIILQASAIMPFTATLLRTTTRLLSIPGEAEVAAELKPGLFRQHVWD